MNQSRNKDLFSCYIKYPIICILLGTAEITIEGDSTIFENLLEFAYTGCIKDLSPDNVCDIMSMAGYLQFTHALTMCKTFVCKKYSWEEKAMSLQRAYEVGISMLFMMHLDLHN